MADKWKEELNAVKKYINNDFIYDIFKRYGFIIDNKFIELNSNINVYESCFISLVTKLYLKKHKKDFNLLEIGFAYGTSTLMFMNQYKKYKRLKSYDIVDMNQSTQWNSIGIKNVKNFMNHEKIKLDYQLYEIDSTKILPKLTKEYDIIFIDGGHDYKTVIQDLNNSNRLLKKNGIMIIDDILHKDVKNALLDFLKNNKNYQKIKVAKVNNKLELVVDNQMYSNNIIKRDYLHPNSMYSFIKK